MPFTRDDLSYASDLVGRIVPPTPQYAWPLLREATGTRVWVKHENHTPTGAFKVRGGLVYADRLATRRPRVKGIVSATRGNHGQSLALAGTSAGLDVTIVVPHGNSRDKNAAMRAFGAEVVEHGHDYQAAREHADELAADRGLGLSTEVVGVVAERAPATARSFAAGRLVTTETADTFVDGVATRVPIAAAVEAINAGAARVLEISEDAVAEAMRLLFTTTHNLAEPAGALSLAGLLSEPDAVRGRKVAVILTGGNVDADVFAEVLAGRTPTP